MASQSDVPSVLIVDDEKRVADTYDLRLQEQYETEVAYSGEEALDKVSDEFDVVLLDRRMPEVSGDEVLEEIRNRGLDVRIVLLTAVDPDFEIVDMECDDYVVKPVDRQELLDVVARAFKIAAYNERMQDLSSKKLKRNVLEVELSEPELRESDTYQELNEQIHDLEQEVGELEEDLDLHDRSRYL